MKTVLVTGGTTRLGKAISDLLRRSGWRVITSSHREDAPCDMVADLSRPSEAAKLYLKALRLDDGFCAIVNNAALFTGEIDDMTRVNYDSPVKLTMLLAGREGVGKCSVVNILDCEVHSMKELRTVESVKDAYLNTKFKLLEFTKKAACLFAQTLRVNAVSPGPVLAPTGVHEKASDTLLENRPTAEDVAKAVLFLLESQSVTGVTIPVDSGAHLIA